MRRGALDGGGYERGQDGGLYGQDPATCSSGATGFKSIADPASRPQTWSTGKIEVGRMSGGRVDTKGTLLEGVGAPGSGTGGGLVAAPQVIPGVVEKLFQPLTLEACSRPARRPRARCGTRRKARRPRARRESPRAATSRSPRSP